MKLTVTSPPTSEPISLTEAKQYLRIDHSDDDNLILATILSAREYVENYTKLALMDQNIRISFSHWTPHLGGESGNYITLPRGPVASVFDIITYGQDDAPQTWSATSYFVALSESRIYRRATAAWPQPGREFLGIEINYRAGFGSASSDVPSTIRQALLMVISYFYENRSADQVLSKESDARTIPLGARALLEPFRRLRL